MSPDDVCRCGHERAWHDSCSKCSCPWFLDPTNASAVKRWNRDKRARERQEKG